MTVTAVDTSAAIPLLIASHPAHHSVRSWSNGRILALSGHALVETFAVLTRLPGDARVAPSDAKQLIDVNFTAACTSSAETVEDIHRELAERDISGGAVYDALVAAAAARQGYPLATRDARARATYDAFGVTVELIG